MKNQHIKKTVHQDALVNCIITSCQPQPNEEDYWAIAIKLAKLNRFIFARSGPLTEIANHTVDLIKAGNIAIQEETHFLTFHGEKARWAMLELQDLPNTVCFKTDTNTNNLLSHDNPPLLIMDPDYVSTLPKPQNLKTKTSAS